MKLRFITMLFVAIIISGGAVLYIFGDLRNTTIIDYYGVRLPQTTLYKLFDENRLPRPESLHCYQLKPGLLNPVQVCFDTKAELDHFADKHTKIERVAD